MPGWLTPALVALVFWGITGVTQKLSTNRISFRQSFLWFCAAFGAIGLATLAFAPLDWNITKADIALAALGGLLNGLGALTSFAALARGGKASIVIPLISLYPLLTVAGSVLFLGETLTGRQIAGVALAIVAAFLLSREGEPGK